MVLPAGRRDGAARAGRGRRARHPDPRRRDLPAAPRVPHSPQRAEGSIGLVIERKRLPHEDDGLMWYCVQCNAKLYEEFFHLEDIEQDFFRVFETFYRDEGL